MHKLSSYLFILLLLTAPLFYSSCNYYPQDYEPTRVYGWVPIYSQTSNSTEIIQVFPPKNLQSPGKIFIKNQYLLVNEISQGIHIFDNSNPSNPSNLGFISIPGNLDLSMRGNILLADFQNGIVSIDLSVPTQAKVLDYVPNVLSKNRIMPIPNDSNRFQYYQCADTTKGAVVGWRKDTVDFKTCSGIIN